MIDLHTHSFFSDGSNSPEELIETAHKIGLSAIALTDHDTVNGCPSFQEAAKKYPNLKAINGCEFNIDHPANIEILALNIQDLAPYIERQQMLLSYREDACLQRIEKLNSLGYTISIEDVLYDKNGKKRPLLAKPHIVNFLYETKQIPSKEFGYKQLLNKGCPAHVEAKAPTAKETICFIRQTGAVSILAHPCLIRLKGNDLFEEIKQLKKFGLQGIEVSHSDMTDEEMNIYQQIADDLKLLKSGGSDFHGKSAHQGVSLGIGKGNLNIPDIYLDEIMKASQNQNNQCMIKYMINHKEKSHF